MNNRFKLNVNYLNIRYYKKLKQCGNEKNKGLKPTLRPTVFEILSK
jgi:hypothetical protein